MYKVELILSDNDESKVYPIFAIDDFNEVGHFIKICLENGYTVIVSQDVPEQTEAEEIMAK